ncbi:T9SS type A sorting domain-containing protein [Sphingobacteriales bacterium CHB3]|nr:T9SS type A sorting domain-containing protein [Sphingobacteriales bacterium CHB3]
MSKSTNNGLSFMTMVRHWRGLIVKPSRMIIDAHNNIHLLHDSLVAGVGPKVVYTRFADANPNNRFDALAPMTALAEWGGDADLAVTPPSSIHYTAVIQTEVPGPNEFRINYARSTDGGGTFSALVVIDSITRPEQISPRIMSRESLVVLAYRVDSSMSHLAVVSTNNGLAFSDPFGFGSDYYGLPGKITSDSQNVYLFYPTYEHPFTGRGRTVFNRFTDPFSPPEEIARFDSLFGDLAIGPTGGKYAAFQKQGIRSALFTGKDIPTSVENARTRLIQAYLLCASPNPFNSSTTLFLDLPITSDIQVRLFNILGQQLYLEERKHVLPGRHAFFVNSSNLTSGIYIANVVTRERSLSLKLLHLK